MDISDEKLNYAINSTFQCRKLYKLWHFTWIVQGNSCDTRAILSSATEQLFNFTYCLFLILVIWRSCMWCLPHLVEHKHILGPVTKFPFSWSLKLFVKKWNRSLWTHLVQMDSKNIEENFISHLFFPVGGKGRFGNFILNKCLRTLVIRLTERVVSPEVVSPKLDSCNLKFLVMSPEIWSHVARRNNYF